jgi:hypothetical protein
MLDEQASILGLDDHPPLDCAITRITRDSHPLPHRRRGDGETETQGEPYEPHLHAPHWTKAPSCKQVRQAVESANRVDE